MPIVSGKALWSIICGQCVLASDEVVGEELENAAEHLKEGLLIFKNWSEEDHKLWCSKSKPKKLQEDFVCNLAKIMDICSEQAMEVFLLFMQYECRVTMSHLEKAMSCEREQTSLLHKIYYFFLSDSLHLYSCQRHVLAADSSHPYKELFKEFVVKSLDPDKKLGKKMMDHLRKLNIKETSKETSSHLPPISSQAKIAHRLSALKHQLVSLLVYYASPENTCQPDDVLTLLQLGQGAGIGRDVVEGFAAGERNAFRTHLETIDVFHCFLLTLVINADSDPSTNALCEGQWVARFASAMGSFGSKVWQSVPLLAWAMLQGRRVSAHSTDEASKYSRLIQRAIKSNAFAFLRSALKIQAFETDRLLLEIGSSIAYSLICITGTCLDLDKIGLTESLSGLAVSCLPFTATAHLFWTEPGGGASILLPGALELFPYVSSPLLDIVKPLATVDENSAQKVFELIRDLESFSWPLTPESAAAVSVNGNLCVAKTDLFPLPGMTIPKDTHGFLVAPPPSDEAPGTAVALVSWQLPVCGWRVVRAHIDELVNAINCGGVPNDLALSTSLKGLGVASAVLSSNPGVWNCDVMRDFVADVKNLLISTSQRMKPNYELVASLLEFFSNAPMDCLQSLWSSLDGTSLLPFLPKPKIVKSGHDVLSNYVAGNARSLICVVEAKSGRFPVLKGLCSLAERSLKFGLDPGSVRGVVVFVAKEAAPAMLSWPYADSAERVRVLGAALSLLHRALTEGTIDRALEAVIVRELSGCRDGAGATLRRVLEGSARLDASFDRPAEWPHSAHAAQLTKMAQLALTLVHRLVSGFVKSGEEMKRFFLEGRSDNPGSFFPSRDRSSAAAEGRHLALTVAQFTFHRINPRLPYLALKILTCLAKEMDVSLVACLGSEAEALRDSLLIRLESDTEDIMVKVALLRLLSLSSDRQPGLARLFLTPPEPLLDSVVNLIHAHKQSKSAAEMELLLSLVEFVSSLFERNLTTATNHLRSNRIFWDALSFCLCHRVPGAVRNDVIGNILKVFAYECFVAGESLSANFVKNLDLFLEESKFAAWTEYIYLWTIKEKVNEMSGISPRNSFGEDADEGLPKDILGPASDFFVVLLSKHSNRLSSVHEVTIRLAVVESLLYLFEVEPNCGSWNELRVTLAEIHLVAMNRSRALGVENAKYNAFLVRLVTAVQTSVTQTSAKCQILILASALKAVTSLLSSTCAQDLGFALSESCCSLVEQHCVLSTASPDDESSAFSRSGCVALSAALLYQCLEPLDRDRVNAVYQWSNIVPVLVEAASKHTEYGNAGVVREIQRVLSLIIQRCHESPQLNTTVLAESISLVLASQHQPDLSVLRDLFWCATFCLRRDGGSAGVEGAIGLLAVHVASIGHALASPNVHPDAALASVALTATLAPFHRLWRVIHPDSFETVVALVAQCAHLTTATLHLRQSLEREVGREKEASVAATSGLSSNTIDLINKLLKILAICLETIRILSPDLLEMLQTPDPETTLGAATLVQASIRRHSAAPGTMPNLATLADVLDLYNTLLPKEGRSTSSVSKLCHESGSKVDAAALRHCAETALYLLLTHSVAFVADPTLPPREARDIKTFLADETSSFFSQWLGRRTVSTSSPILPPQSPKSPLSDLPYFMLCRKIVSAVNNPSV